MANQFDFDFLSPFQTIRWLTTAFTFELVADQVVERNRHTCAVYETRTVNLCCGASEKVRKSPSDGYIALAQAGATDQGIAILVETSVTSA